MACVLCATSGCRSSALSEHRLIRSVVFEPSPGDHRTLEPIPGDTDSPSITPRPRRPVQIVLAPDDA